MEQSLGAVLSPIDVRDYQLVCSSATTYPTSFELENMPEAKSQGLVSSCVAHALATIIEYISRKQGDETSEFSVGFIYGNRRETTYDDHGLIVRDALKTVCKYGNCIKEKFRYNIEVPDAIAVFENNYENLYQDALPHRFSSFYSCRSESEIKSALQKGYPLIIAIRWYKDIKVADGVLTTSRKESKQSGAHALVIYGWNETGWLIQNSHGKIWGDNGRATLPYDYPILEAYGIIDEISESMKSKRIQELELEVLRLLTNIDNLCIQVNKFTDLYDQINNTLDFYKHYTEMGVDDEKFILEKNCIIEDLYNQTKEMTVALTKTNEELTTLRTIIGDRTAEIEKLKNELVEIKKPFQSKFGKIVAKVLNAIFNMYNISINKQTNDK